VQRAEESRTQGRGREEARRGTAACECECEVESGSDVLDDPQAVSRKP
jgi:hypothetical protein